MKEDTIYLTYADIAERTGIPVPTLRVRRHRGQMPPPDYQPNSHVALWLPKTIEEWMPFCDECQGEGVWSQPRPLAGYGDEYMDCPYCNGSGFKPQGGHDGSTTDTT